MAATQSHRFLGAAAGVDRAPADDQFQLEEADIFWSTDDVVFQPEKGEHHASHKHRKRYLRKNVTKSAHHPPIGAKSLPVNIPDWSKILGGEFRIRAAEFGDEYEEEEDWGNDRIAPHEYLARTRVASLSVHDGVGRTLKGRDLSRVRNAVWKKIGFED